MAKASFIFRAKLAEQAERYHEMKTCMKEVRFVCELWVLRAAAAAALPRRVVVSHSHDLPPLRSFALRHGRAGACVWGGGGGWIRARRSPTVDPSPPSPSPRLSPRTPFFPTPMCTGRDDGD